MHADHAHVDVHLIRAAVVAGQLDLLLYVPRRIQRSRTPSSGGLYGGDITEHGGMEQGDLDVYRASLAREMKRSNRRHISCVAYRRMEGGGTAVTCPSAKIQGGVWVCAIMERGSTVFVYRFVDRLKRTALVL